MNDEEPIDSDEIIRTGGFLNSERIDKCIDMRKKLYNLAMMKDKNINAMLVELGEIQKLPTEDEILASPDTIVPILERNLIIIFEKLMEIK